MWFTTLKSLMFWWPTDTANTQIPRILVTLTTSSPILSRSGTPSFTITLEATADSNSAITVDSFDTVLHPRMPALDYQGLTFTDAKTGELAKRSVIDIQYQVPDFLDITSESVIEIPSKDAEHAYAVSHTFKVPQVKLLDPDEPLSTTEQQLRELVGRSTGKPTNASISLEAELYHSMSQVVGFHVGHTYEIGLGSDMTAVSWWRPGKKSDGFAQGRLRRTSAADTLRPRIEMVSTNKVSFEVVE